MKKKSTKKHWLWLVVIAVAAGALVLSVSTGGLAKALQRASQVRVVLPPLEGQQAVGIIPQLKSSPKGEVQSQQVTKSVTAYQLKLDNLEVAQAWSDLVLGNLEKLVELILGIGGVFGLLRAKKKSEKEGTKS